MKLICGEIYAIDRDLSDSPLRQIMRNERIEFASPGLEASNEFRRVRSKNTFRRVVDMDEYALLTKLHEEDDQKGSSYFLPLEYLGDSIKFERKKPLWEAFEDKVWSMFYHLKTPIMPKGKTIVEYDEDITKQIDGLYSDHEYVYVVECKWRKRKGRVDQPPDGIADEIRKWRGIWDRLVYRLSEIEEFAGKKFRFILATTGILWTKQLRKEAEGFATLIDNHKVDELIKLTKLIGVSARTNLLQALFLNEELPSPPPVFPCIRSEVSGTNTYYFFAKPSQIIDLCYVPRRNAGNQLGLGTAYQRMLKSTKVNQIRDYLDNPSNFFPNSIIASSDRVFFDATDGSGEQGFLHLPNLYGSVKVIDGQHRLFGSISREREKPLPICVVEGLSGLQQSQLFTQINQKQSNVPSELLWDLYGEGVDLSKVDENDKSDVIMARNFVISKIWKNMNERKSHPLCGRIIVPSQTEKSDMCHISFGQICGFLGQNKTIWTHGYLKGTGTWEEAMAFSEFRVEQFFRYLHHYMKEEFEKPNGKKENWLLSNYSFEALLKIFSHACLFWGGVDRDKWLKSNNNKEVGNAKELIKELAEILSRALVDRKLGFFNEAGKRDITKAGNSAQRGEYMKDVVRFIRKDNIRFSQHFAPRLEIKDEKEGEYPSAEVSDRLKELELGYADLIHKTMEETHGDNWWNYVPNDVQNYIENQIEYKKMQLKEFSKKPDIVWLHQTSPAHLLVIVKHKSMIKPWRERIKVKPDLFESTWRHGFEILRNMNAHNDPYPNEHTKNMVLGSIGMLEGWLDVAYKEENIPIITLLGGPEISVGCGTTWVDPGATAHDVEDGDLTGMITKSGDVDTNKEGNYMITYDVIDSDGNEAVSVIRTVNVIEGSG